MVSSQGTHTIFPSVVYVFGVAEGSGEKTKPTDVLTVKDSKMRQQCGLNPSAGTKRLSGWLIVDRCGG